MSKSQDDARRLLRGQQCGECGHALAAHNSLGYCSRRSEFYGECTCPTGYSRLMGATPRLTLEDHRQMRRDHMAQVRRERASDLTETTEGERA